MRTFFFFFFFTDSFSALTSVLKVQKDKNNNPNKEEKRVTVARLPNDWFYNYLSYWPEWNTGQQTHTHSKRARTHTHLQPACFHGKRANTSIEGQKCLCLKVIIHFFFLLFFLSWQTGVRGANEARGGHSFELWRGIKEWGNKWKK